VYIYGSYRKIKTAVPLFWSTMYMVATVVAIRQFLSARINFLIASHRVLAHAQEDNNDFRSSYSSSTLVIMTFMPRFQGNYTCVASNVFRMKKQTFYVNGINQSYLVAPVCLRYLRVTYMHIIVRLL